jgi:hypothetical protein
MSSFLPSFASRERFELSGPGRTIPGCNRIVHNLRGKIPYAHSRGNYPDRRFFSGKCNETIRLRSPSPRMLTHWTPCYPTGAGGGEDPPAQIERHTVNTTPHQRLLVLDVTLVEGSIRTTGIPHTPRTHWPPSPGWSGSRRRRCGGSRSTGWHRIHGSPPRL